MTKLHRLDANGLAGLQRALDAVGAKPDAMTLLHRWAAMVAHRPSRSTATAASSTGGNADAFTADIAAATTSSGPTRRPTATPAPGQRRRLRPAARRQPAGSSADEISLDRASRAPTPRSGQPVEWTVDSTPPDAADGEGDTCATPPAAGTGAPALYSGCGDNLDRSIARTVTVPAGDPTLTFDALWDIEEALGLRRSCRSPTTTARPGRASRPTDTTSEHDPDADPAIVDQLPGLTASSDGYQTETADLTDWAGQDVLIAFRYMTDGAAGRVGLVGPQHRRRQARPFPATLDGWQTQTQLNPTRSTTGRSSWSRTAPRATPVQYHRMRLDGSHAGTLSGDALREAIGSTPRRSGPS